MGDLGSVHPILNFLPGGVILQVPGHHVKRDPGTLKHTGDFRAATRLTMFQPHAGHSPAVAELVELLIIQLRYRLQVEHDHRYVYILHHRQDR